MKPKLFIEPFAGGASVAISLLESDIVDEIALSDANELVASFWKVVFSQEGAALADSVFKMKLDLKNYKKVKNIRPDNDFAFAKKCLYLNRTNFSGILHDWAGPIGGWKQEKYQLDCRFPKEWVAERILGLSRLKDRVRFVRHQSYRQTIKHVRQFVDSRRPNSIFWYLDPPFFKKAHRLYQNSFSELDHSILAEQVRYIPGNWLLSYDDVAETRHYYAGKPGLRLVELAYSAKKAGENRVSSREAIVSNLPFLPVLEEKSDRRIRNPLLVFDGWDEDRSPSADARPLTCVSATRR